jgi:hypothetical protein
VAAHATPLILEGLFRLVNVRRYERGVSLKSRSNHTDEGQGSGCGRR